MNKKTDFEHASVRTFCFENGTEVAEYQMIVSVTSPTLTFAEQVAAVQDALECTRREIAPRANVVLKRYFLSDATNQVDLLKQMEGGAEPYALSFVQQPPLNGTKIALWAYLATGMQMSRRPSGLIEARHGAYRHLWSTPERSEGPDAEQQTLHLFDDYIKKLAEEGCTLADNCMRTWLFVNDIDHYYAGVVKARNDIFATQNLTTQTHFLPSTGIEGGRGFVQMDAYAIAGIQREQIGYLHAPTHLNRTSDYGVSFERGAYIDLGDRRQVLVSGTASINNRGEIVYPGDVAAQCHRMWENVEALLAESGCTYEDAAQMIVYLRDPADYAVVRQLFEKRFPNHPWLIVLASVCRPGWLIEMETMAIKSHHTPWLK